jgi:hypothetical protein
MSTTHEHTKDEKNQKNIERADSQEVNELTFEAATRVVDSVWGCAPSAPGFLLAPDKSL